MKIHEYQAKQILARSGVAVLGGQMAETVDQAVAAAGSLGTPVVVVKAQIHAGGRGKGRFKELASAEDLKAVLAGAEDVPGPGGVSVCKGTDAVRAAAERMLGNTLVTKQTGLEGSVVRRLYVEAGCDIDKEFYLSVLLDRSVGRVLIMASTEGGTEIEEVAEKHPERILKVWADPAVGLGAWQARQIAFGLGLSGRALKSCIKFVMALYDAYVTNDCSLAEINPLVVTKQGDVIALDCKMSFDDNALYRHPDVVEMRDIAEEDPIEVEASRYGLSYVKLDGNIGCMVNGAGLAMATMDIIKFYGSEPANFLDVGGGANQEKVAAAFRIITADPAVKGILVNIFGGIMKCDTIANGVIAAVKETGLDLPLVVRLDGTNVDLGKRILAESGLALIAADDMADAAQKIVDAVNAREAN
ncbi:MAG: ADP-forming succinate--CoA ligase subunit beta [Alphaproteobacteria bacterium]|nr:ADP-forming succinate--CoA ligase subunit beta [Alphaproteobacteria bacterium]